MGAMNSKEEKKVRRQRMQAAQAAKIAKKMKSKRNTAGPNGGIKIPPRKPKVVARSTGNTSPNSQGGGIGVIEAMRNARKNKAKRARRKSQSSNPTQSKGLPKRGKGLPRKPPPK